MLTITVSDSGMGIDKADINKLFSDYSRLNLQANWKTEGTGLGLSITRKIAEMMGGSITVESEYGKGSKFTAKFMQNTVSKTVIGKETADSLRSLRYHEKKLNMSMRINRIKLPYARVLVVDDNMINLDVASGLMKPYGMQITCVTSGQAAVDAIASCKEDADKYNAIFMDHMMPDMDGIQATNIIRSLSTDYAKNIPIIALTANAIIGNEQMFLENGFQDFLTKPVDIARLDEVIRKWVRIKDHKDEYTTIDTSSSGAKDELLVRKLSEIPGLNAEKGLANMGYDSQGYTRAIRQFCEGADAYIEELTTFMKAKDWKNYSIKAHALKGVLAIFGAEERSQWALKLEKASKDENDIAVCIEETAPFCAALAEFKDALIATSLFETKQKETENKEKGAPVFMKKQIELLEKACAACSTQEAESIIAGLTGYSWDKDTDLGLEKISGLVASYEYEEALEEISKIKKGIIL